MDLERGFAKFETIHRHKRFPGHEKHIPRPAVVKIHAKHWPRDCEPLSRKEAWQFWGVTLAVVALYALMIAYAVSR